jgi:hypothetical protein
MPCTVRVRMGCRKQETMMAFLAPPTEARSARVIHVCGLLRPRQPACNTRTGLPLPCMRVRSGDPQTRDLLRSSGAFGAKMQRGFQDHLLLNQTPFGYIHDTRGVPKTQPFALCGLTHLLKKEKRRGLLLSAEPSATQTSNVCPYPVNLNHQFDREREVCSCTIKMFLSIEYSCQVRL